MRTYEMMMILQPQLDEEAFEAMLNKTTGLITAGQGEIKKVDRWGKRRLAYEIKDCTDGFYVVIEFDADNDTTSEVERILKITDEVVRFLLVRKDEE